jgi:hypothetical protein
MRGHVFVNELLQVDSQRPTAADQHIGADAAACGGSSSTGSISESGAFNTLVTADCTKLAACCTSIVVASCVTSINAREQAAFNAEAADTLLTYDGDATGRCVDEVKGWSCEQFVNGTYSPNCGAIFRGTVANGGACAGANECTSTLCKGVTYDNSGNVTTPGTCVAQAALGQSCANLNTAYSGAICASGTIESDTSSCVCVAPYANGAACTYDALCASPTCDPMSHTCVAYPQLSTLPAATCNAIASTLH